MYHIGARYVQLKSDFQPLSVFLGCWRDGDDFAVVWSEFEGESAVMGGQRLVAAEIAGVWLFESRDFDESRDFPIRSVEEDEAPRAVCGLGLADFNVRELCSGGGVETLTRLRQAK